MSITKQVTVWCDAPGCAEWEQFSERASVGRKRLRERGWTRIAGKDYCPEHGKRKGAKS